MEVLCIIGPSGCGKSSVVAELIKSGLVFVTPTYTDRPPRPGEIALEHHFVSAKQFDTLINQKKLISDVVQPFGLPFRYALPRIEFQSGKVPLVMTRAYFLPLFAKHYPNYQVYQIEASLEFAQAQLAKRKDTPLGTRISQFKEEKRLGQELANRVFTNRQSQLGLLVEEVITAVKQDFSNTLSQTTRKHVYSKDRRSFPQV